MMGESAPKNNEEKIKKTFQNEDDGESTKDHSLFYEYFIAPDYLTTLSYINILIIYLLILTIIAHYQVNPWLCLLFFPVLYAIDTARKARKEKERVEVAHCVPFFADALANSLAVGSTLEEALIQASYYLKGTIKKEFQSIMIKQKFGNDLGQMLRELDVRFPNTGLVYLVSLLDAYSELGIGISPLLKRIAVVLTEKEKAEEKVRTILYAGSSYARITVGIFAGIFFALSFLMRKQMGLLFLPTLKPILIMLIAWTFIGILIVTRISALEFSRNFALRPYIKKFITERKLDDEKLMEFSGIEWTQRLRQINRYSPLLGGMIIAYITAWYSGEPLIIGLGFILGTLIFHSINKYILKGMVEDQLIKTIEIFPDILQVFIIGLNSGLNTYLSFKFAQSALKAGGTALLKTELCRANFAMECGEDNSRTWQILAKQLPFEIVVDFCEIMVVSPLAGESIVNSIIQTTNSYQDKKLKYIEKKAGTISQIIIPLIIMIFLPLFLFVMLAPLIVNITKLL